MNWKKFAYILVLIMLLVFSIWSWTSNRNTTETLLDTTNINYMQDPNNVYVFPPFYEVHKNDKLEFDISKIKNLEDKSKFDESLRKKLFSLTNFLTKPDQSPKIKILEEVDKGSYTQQKVSIIMYPSTITYAYMLARVEK